MVMHEDEKNDFFAEIRKLNINPDNIKIKWNQNFDPTGNGFAPIASVDVSYNVKTRNYSPGTWVNDALDDFKKGWGKVGVMTQT